MAEPEYEIYALRYGARTDWNRGKSYLADPKPETPDAIEYYLWVIRNADRTIVVDTGFDEATAQRFGRKPFDNPVGQLAQFGIDAAAVDTVIVTHLHFDHAGSFAPFTKAKFHLQRADLEYATSALMKYQFLSFPYDRVHVEQMAGYAKEGRVIFHDGDGDIAPGITVHRIDGHAVGLQVVRVNTARGVVVLASDSAAFIEQFAEYRVSPAVIDARDMLMGYDRLRELADSEDHIITGHDPITSLIYPRVPGIAPVVVRVDAPPSQSIRVALDAWKNRKI